MNTATGRKSSDKNWIMNRNRDKKNRDKNKNRIRNLNAENASSGEDTQQKLTNQLTDKKHSRGQILRQLFFSTLYLSAFTFGGGYVIVTLLKKKFVDDLHWIDNDEMLDLVAIAQSSPGAIAVNGAIVVGYKLAGVPGVLVWERSCTLSTVWSRISGNSRLP